MNHQRLVIPSMENDITRSVVLHMLHNKLFNITTVNSKRIREGLISQVIAFCKVTDVNPGIVVHSDFKFAVSTGNDDGKSSQCLYEPCKMLSNRKPTNGDKKVRVQLLYSNNNDESLLVSAKLVRFRDSELVEYFKVNSFTTTGAAIPDGAGVLILRKAARAFDKHFDITGLVMAITRNDRRRYIESLNLLEARKKKKNVMIVLLLC